MNTIHLTLHTIILLQMYTATSAYYKPNNTLSKTNHIDPESVVVNGWLICGCYKIIILRVLQSL